MRIRNVFYHSGSGSDQYKKLIKHSHRTVELGEVGILRFVNLLQGQFRVFMKPEQILVSLNAFLLDSGGARSRVHHCLPFVHQVPSSVASCPSGLNVFNLGVVLIVPLL